MAGSTALSELLHLRLLPDDVRKALQRAASECNPEDLTEWWTAVDELQDQADREEPPSPLR